MSKMKFALVGCGRIATLHVAGYKDNPDGELYGVYDKNLSCAQKFAKEHSVPKVYESFEELLADEQIIGVEILVPHHLHCEMTIQACKAKKHVSVQKPMALNLEECDKMILAAQENNVKLRVYENFIFYPPYQFAKKLLDSGEIGKPQSMRYKMNNCGLCSLNTPASKMRAKAVGVKMDEELKPTGWKINPLSWAWRLNESLSGGGPVVFDDGYHKFSVIMNMLGDVEKVNAWIDYTPVMPGVYQDAPATIMWKQKDSKVYGVFDVSCSKDMYIQSKYYTCDERMEITGSRGIIWVTRCTATLMPEVAPVVMYKDGKMQEFWDMPNDWQDSFINCTKDFIECIRDDRQPVLSGEKGREILKFALAAIDSSNKKKEIYLDCYEDKELCKRKGFFHIFKKKR